MQHIFNDKYEKFYLTRFQRFSERLKKHIFAEKADLNGSYRLLDGYQNFENSIAGDFQELKHGQDLAGAWGVIMIKLCAQIPQDWAGKRVVAELDFDAEGLIFDPQGRALQSITNGSVFDSTHARDWMTLADPAQGGEDVEFYIEVCSTGIGGVFPAFYPDTQLDDPDRYGKWSAQAKRFSLRVFDQELFDFYIDFQTLAGLVETLPEKAVRRAQIMNGLNDAMDVYGEHRGDVAAAQAIL